MAEIIDVTPSPEGSEPDMTRKIEEIVEDLHECLTNITGTGSFALFEALPNPPNPGILLNEGGCVGLPLSDRDAQAIVAASHEAPFGKGDQTIVDKAAPYVDAITAKVSIGLGVDANGKGVSAHLYKMLLYDEGAHFKPRQDSEKTPGMFATLVVALPSKHEGGEVRVSHAGETRVFETSKFSDYNASFLAWFSDVTHEVKPVISGHRLVLTYNLVHRSLGPRDLSASSDSTGAKLGALFSEWKEGLHKSPYTRLVAYELEHQYTDASLCLGGLKGKDQVVGMSLQQVCKEFGFSFYLANFEQTIYGECDEGDVYRQDFHAITEHCDRSASLLKVVELDGSEVAKHIQFSVENFTRDVCFEDSDPDDEDYSGYTGNEGVSATHFYRRTVAIIMPRSYRFNFFFGPGNRKFETTNSEILVWLDRSVKLLESNPSDQLEREDVESMCEVVLRETKGWRQSVESYKTTSRWTYSGRPSTNPPFTDQIMNKILMTIANVLKSERLIAASFDVWPEKDYMAVISSIGAAMVTARISRYDEFHERLQVIEVLRAGMISQCERAQTSQTMYQQWAVGEIDKALVTTRHETAKDGKRLADLAAGLTSQEVFNKVWLAFTRGARRCQAAFKARRPAYHFNDRSLPSQAIEVDDQTGRNTTTVLCKFLELDLQSEMRTICGKLHAEIVEGASPTLMQSLYIPCLKETFVIQQNEKLPVELQYLVQTVLTRYYARYVGGEPQRPANWTRGISSCSCNDCQSLNGFLESPHQQTGSFSLGTKRRAHLHGQLDNMRSVTHETRHVVNPHTLIVTKTNSDYEQKHQRWTERRQTSLAHVKAMDLRLFEKHLPGKFQKIMNFWYGEPLITTPAVPASLNRQTPLSSISNAANASRTLPPITKRKTPASNTGPVEVIELD
ncbi:hypothetical protein BJ875DRAFT_437669 [Amylocarpus encephaloides]|uniref:Prolyl 4-hydroxylase alpha subunit Fe(2+) 2OG dioxygenase domain-containing protein n=1 Tax=Amylocarpus encephaloides TaxID=45428 RepID=A0A9P7YR86_9HELO|nr:hypothetical protein BJ875DRAFT_437669 [Amylocarpus encephaloides]